MKMLYEKTGCEESLMPFQKFFDCARKRVYTTSWKIKIYESYISSVITGKAVLVDFSSDEKAMVKLCI